MAALGERFRAAREARGLSLSDVAEQIRIRSVYLGAIEDENWNAIGAPVYTRGFLRTYARFLGLDPEEIVAQFNEATGSPGPAAPSAAPPPGASYSPPRSSGNLSPLIWIASIVAVILIAFVTYNAFTLRSQPPAPLAANPTALPSNSPAPAAIASPGASPTGGDAPPSPSASPSGAPSPGSDTARTLEVRVSAPSWIRVAVDGNVSMEGTFPAGTARVFHGKNAVVLIGNAAGVKLVVDGKDLGKLGASGDVIQRSFTL